MDATNQVVGIVAGVVAILGLYLSYLMAPGGVQQQFTKALILAIHACVVLFGVYIWADFALLEGEPTRKEISNLLIWAFNVYTYGKSLIERLARASMTKNSGD